jgi:TldD protein
VGAVDPGFLALALDDVRDAALDRAAALGCRHAEVRIEKIRDQLVTVHDGAVEGADDDVSLGVGVRVVHGGAMGFAATVAVEPSAARAVVDQAVELARLVARAGSAPVELTPEPAHPHVTWVAPYRTDPTAVPLADKIDLLGEWSGRLSREPGVDHVVASLRAVAEDKHYGDLGGNVTTQRRVRVHPSVEVIGLAPDGGSFETMRTCAPPVARGYEYLEGDGWDFAAELEQMPGWLVDKLGSPTVEPGCYDLVLDATNLWLTIHESVGHATELDRALGYEAALAGTSFATPDRLGTLRYGSELMQVTGDRTTPYGLATAAYDDEGTATTSFDIVRDGILVGYQLDRRTAAEAGVGRSNGCAFADSYASVPIQRMANVSLAHGGRGGPSTDELIAGVDRGIYVVGDKSWSIDMQRSNFQFTGQRFYAIERGRITHQLRDVAYQATTTQFWGSLVRLGGESTYVLSGAMNCGKGQPGQIAPVSHGCPSVHVAGVRVVNAREESGR